MQSGSKNRPVVTPAFLRLSDPLYKLPKFTDLIEYEVSKNGVSAGYEAKTSPDLSVCFRIEASTLREEVLRYSPPKVAKERSLDVF